MALRQSELPTALVDRLRRGIVIPAHPLALDDDRRFDPVHQRALTRYYLDAGAGGLAVGAYNTQVAIRDVGLYEPVLSMAAETVAAWTDEPVILVAGLVGRTDQALAEARIAVGLGYHAGMLNLGAYNGAGEDEIVEHCRRVAEDIPLFGFYLLPECGGVRLSADFWRRFSGIDNVIAIKVAPFNRYFTLDVIRGVVAAGAEDRIAIYTGNDDHIVGDLLTPFVGMRDGEEVIVRMRGGLLGHWSFWTQRAVELLARIHAAHAAGVIDDDLMAMDARVTDCNAAIYDGTNNIRGCIPGCHEVLRRQGLLRNNLCLDPELTLSPGQMEDIDRVCAAYPDLADDAFVRANLDRWLTDRGRQVEIRRTAT